jgi:hypothetical protein
MIYGIIIILAAFSYHILSYGMHLIRKEKNTLAAVGVILIAVINLAAPIILIIFNY